jgi:hypothetical protein
MLKTHYRHCPPHRDHRCDFSITHLTTSQDRDLQSFDTQPLFRDRMTGDSIPALLRFHGQEDLRDWYARTAIDVGHANVRGLVWLGIESLKAFEQHLRVLVNVHKAEFHECRIFRSLEDVQRLTLLGANLVHLEISGGETEPGHMASLLFGLPLLRRLSILLLEVKDDPVLLLASPPFFVGYNEMSLGLTDYSRGRLSWIPENAQFSSLSIGSSLLRRNLKLVNNWIHSSGRGLKRFRVEWDPEGG